MNAKIGKLIEGKILAFVVLRMNLLRPHISMLNEKGKIYMLTLLSLWLKLLHEIEYLRDKHISHQQRGNGRKTLMEKYKITREKSGTSFMKIP